MRKATRGLGIDSKIGVAALQGERERAVGVLLSQASISFKPCEVDIGQTRYDMVDSVNVPILQLKYSIEEWSGFMPLTEHHQRLSTHCGQPYLDIKSQCLPIEFDDFVRTVRGFDVHRQRLGHAA